MVKLRDSSVALVTFSGFTHGSNIMYVFAKCFLENGSIMAVRTQQPVGTPGNRNRSLSIPFALRKQETTLFLNKENIAWQTQYIILEETSKDSEALNFQVKNQILEQFP